MTAHIEADVVIIGSGVAGTLTAWRLARNGVKNVVILEAGPRIDRGEIIRKFRESPVIDASSGFPDPDWAPRPAWREKEKNPYIQSVGPESSRLEYLRVVGGTTWHWAGCTPRHLPVDFRLKSTYGVGADWPIDYTALEPYYTEAEYELGVAGDPNSDYGSPRSRPFPLPPIPLGYADKYVRDRLKAIGISFQARPAARATQPYNGRNQCQGFGTCSPMCPTGAQYAAIQHIERLEKLGVRVIENTRVDRIVADGRVTALEAKRPDGTSVTVNGRIFVLAANAMETPRLLLMSVSEKYPRGLANGSGLVGRNFMDHSALVCRMLMPDPVWSGRGPESIIASPTFRDGNFRKKSSAFLLSIENRIQLNNITNELLQTGLEPPELDTAIRDRARRQVEFVASIEKLPDPKNGITLDWNRRDRAGQPEMRHYYSFNDYEIAGFAHCRTSFTHIAQTLKAEILAILGPVPNHHPAGMTIMGKNPKTSVLDAFGRTHDHPNLFVVSSSMFPSSGTANPTLTIAALGLRTADEIVRQLRS